MINNDVLIQKALEAMEHSYAPYSKFNVGAAVQTQDGSIFTGANIENVAFPAGICAERVALAKAISEGHKSFLAIAVTSSSDDMLIYPCGVCRQFLSEFCKDTTMIIANKETIKEHKFSELLPYSFNAFN